MNINTKILIGFLLLIICVFTQLFVWYRLQVNILENTRQINDVESPIKTIAEQVVGYNAMMDEQVHMALIHAERGDYSKIQSHREKYNSIEIRLDDLLKKDARILLVQSKRPDEMKIKVENNMKELDRLNFLLDELRIKSFNAMENQDVNTAYSLVVGGDYDIYSDEFNRNYKNWVNVEDVMILNIRNNLFKESQRLIFSNLIFSLVITMVLLVTIVLARVHLTSCCIFKDQ